MMKAAVLHGIRDIRLEELDAPPVDDDGILVRVRSASVCGTDVRMFRNGRTGGRSDPLIPGHEMSGTVESTNQPGGAYRAGTRVAVAPNMGCGTCDLCVNGSTHLCPDYRALGIHLDGAFAELVAVPGRAVAQGNLVELSDHVSFDEAALAEPLSCVYNGFERCRIGPGDSVLIFGAGPIGIMHGLLARMAGAAPVMFSDVSDERLALCHGMDDAFVTVRSETVKDDVMRLTGNKGVDVGITACPAPEAQVLAVELAAIDGRVLFFGGLPADREQVNLNTNLIHYRQLVVTGTARARLSHYRKCLELIERKIIDVKPLVTTVCRLEDVPDVLAAASGGKDLKTMIAF